MMQSRIFFLILSLGALAVFNGCERHQWENTRKLHSGHGTGEGHHPHHHEGEEGKGTHHPDEGEGNGEKSAEHPSSATDDSKGQGNSEKTTPKGKPRTL